MNFRVGIGYDVHKLVFNRDLILGGVLIPHQTGLLGHSDADVLTHAIIDSLLGATKNADIGILFPDNDKKYKNISSLALLGEVSSILKVQNYSISNIDCVIIAQKPKMKDFIPEMEENIAKTLNISIDQINIKATTEEGLGFTGREEGIASKAVSLVYKN